MAMLFVTDDADMAAMSTVALHATTCHWQQKGRCYGVQAGLSNLCGL